MEGVLHKESIFCDAQLLTTHTLSAKGPTRNCDLSICFGWASFVDRSKHRHAKRARVIFLVIGSRSIRRAVHSNDLISFLGGYDVQQEGNWKSIICKYNVT